MSTSDTEAYSDLKTVFILSKKTAGGTYLMQEAASGKHYIKKIIDNDKLPIYQSLQALKHRGLAEILAIEEEADCLVIIKEYIAGETLAAMLAREKTVSEADAIQFIRQLCLILNQVHQKGIIHRDITPNNIMITSAKVLKLIDFGIARTYKETQTQDTQLLGTPGFAAPEQFGFDQTTPGSDIFALGVLFNVMLTGGKPNEVQTKNEKLAAIIRSCTAMEPAARYQDVMQIEYDLRQLLEATTGHQVKKPFPISRHIPGFRTEKTLKKIIASCGYILIALLTSLELAMTNNPFSALFFLTTRLYLPFLWLVNIGHFDRRVIILRATSPGFARLFRIIAFLIWLLNVSW